MKLRHLLISVPALVLLPAGALAARSSPVEPGGKIGKITLVSLPEAKADYEIFQFCRPDILKPGRYKRSCTVPYAKLLFVGYGDFETTRAKLGLVWPQIHWTMSLDGRPVDLRRFGTEDRVLPAYPPAGGKTAYLRLWKVMAEDVSPGKHTLRYVSRQSGFGTIDATWTFVVPKRQVLGLSGAAAATPEATHGSSGGMVQKSAAGHSETRLRQRSGPSPDHG